MRHNHHVFSFTRRGGALLAFALTLVSGIASATTTLSDIPVGSASNVPANLMLSLSVEFPTGTVAAYKDASSYSSSSVYLGYFDNTKCYDYYTDTNNNNAAYFVPFGAISSSGSCIDSNSKSHWSGNMLNWATMTALDEFRQSLTGGNRALPSPGTPANGDTTSLTVLLRSNLNGQSTSGNFTDKSVGKSVNVAASTVIGDSAFNSTTATIHFRSYGQGSQFLVSTSSSFPATGSGTTTKTFNAAVQVCASTMLESNCNSAHKTTDYPNAGVYNKPEGLIQQNYQRIRVGAAGYEFSSGNRPANGAVRALIRDNGPDTYNGNGARNYYPCSSSNKNPNSEWDCATGIFSTNSEPSTTGLAPGGGNPTSSGAIQYLNTFGYASGYETYDTIGDLYWASLAYLMNVPLDSSYTTGLSSSNSLDVNFPVYTGTSLNDPLQYTCQANSIVTIGDAHTWYDTRVPSTGTPNAGSGMDALSPVNGADAGAYATLLGNLPLVEGTTQTMASLFGSGTSLGNMNEPNGTSDSTYNMAGLAYFAHTQDIRPAITLNGTTTDKLPGKQTVDTYTVDVLEPGSYDGTSGKEIFNPGGFNTGGGAAGPNMYWLAAKYGGFNDVNGDGVPANFLTWHTNTSTAAAKNLRPDNYFPGNRPDLIQAGLAQIFNKVSTSTQSAAGPGVTLSRVLVNVPNTGVAPYYSTASGFPIYTVSYTPTTWTGDVTGFIASATSPGSVNPVTGSPTWSAQSKLDALTKAQGATSTQYGWDTGRRIITSTGSAGIPFRFSSLSSTEQTAIGASTMVNYLRGDQSNESVLYRARNHILGDIVHSQPVLVQNALSPTYNETANPGYASFATTVANRQPVVYVGANDGMMHAFAADFSASTVAQPFIGGGSELFAYVPSLLYSGPNSTPNVDGLAAMGNLNGVSTNDYAHHFYVDQTPQAADVDFHYTAANPYTTPPTLSTAANASWHTMVIGGLGKGGKGFYALDATTVPAAIDATSSTAASEQTLATSKVLWEFSGSDMGYSYGAPLVVKTRKYGWVVLVTSGYNNPTGIGHLYVLNAATGALLETLSTTAGSPSTPSGLAQATGYTKDVTDNTVEQVYAGDLLGNVWRFDLSGATGSYPAPTLFAQLTDASGKGQPITTAPRIELDLSSTQLGTRRWVFVGTGQALDASDLSNTQQQTMYALRDGDNNSPSTTGLPITRSTTTLHKVTDLTHGVTVADSDAGWYYDLTGSAGTNGGTERIVVNPDAAAGTYVLAWATMTPSSDPCALGGNIYAVAFGSGGSVLLDSAGNPMAYMNVPTAPTGVEQVQLPGTNQISILYGQTQGQPGVGKEGGGPTSPIPSRVNWREVLN